MKIDSPLLETQQLRLSNGHSLRLARLGSALSQPPIVLLHGYPENLQVWSSVAHHLASGVNPPIQHHPNGPNPGRGSYPAGDLQAAGGNRPDSNSNISEDVEPVPTSRASTDSVVVGPAPTGRASTDSVAVGPVPTGRASTDSVAVGPVPTGRASTGPAREVVAFDWPGMGYSDAWPGGATPEIKARRLRTILDELQIERPVVVGLDMGGQPALAYAALFPERIEKLVVMNSLVFGDSATSWEIRLLRRFGFNRFVLRNLPGLVFRRAERTFLPTGVRIDAALRDDFWRAFSQPAVRRFISKMCAGYQGTLDALPRLYRTITCPTQVLWAEHDKHFPPIQGERLADAIPGAELTVLAGGTHWMPLVLASEVAAAIAD